MLTSTVLGSIYTACSVLFLVAVVNSQASDDDYEQPDRFRTCDAASYCVPIRRCSYLRGGWNRPGVGKTCGHGTGPYRSICCPMSSIMADSGQQEVRQTKRPRTTTTSLPPPGRGNSEDCGLSLDMDWYREKAINDTEGLEATWPWMVAIMYQRSRNTTVFWCSGFLIDKTHVLSGARCFEDKSHYGGLSARIGSDEHDSGEEYQISEIKLHEKYIPRQIYHDIALLTLAREVNVTNFVPICLPDDRIAATDLTGWGVTIVGWGSEVFGGPMSISLKQLDDVPIVSNRECQQIVESFTSDFERRFPRGMAEDILCAGQTEGSRDACNGDSGAPAMLLYRKRWIAVGITSFGFNCGIPGIPGGYTRISSYLDWIRQSIQNESLVNQQNSSTPLS